MKLSAFSPESVGDGFLAVREQMSAADFLAALLVSLAAAAAAALLYRFFYERRGTGSQIHRAFPLLALSVTTLFIGVQVYTVYISYVLNEKSIGGAAESGATVAVACIGGFIMGILYGKLAVRTRNLTFAAGLFVMALSYLILALAGSMAMIYVGGFVYGIAMAICMPAAFVNTANSVDAFSSAMALSITMCAQNLGQFVCPYIMNFVTGMTGSLHPSTLTYVLAAVLLTGMGVPAVLWGMRKNRKETV